MRRPDAMGPLPPARNLPEGRKQELREDLMATIRQEAGRVSRPRRSGRLTSLARPRWAGALAALALGAVAIAGGAIWLSGGSEDGIDTAAGATAPTTQASETQDNGDGGRGINAVLAVHSIRTVTGDMEPIASESGSPFSYLVLDLPGTELDEAYEVVDDATGEFIGIQTVYHQWWANDEGDTVGRELLLRVQEVGEDYYWLTHLTELAESSKSVRIGDRDVTVYRIPDVKIEEGSYDLDVFYWVEEPGVEAILIPWVLSGDGASGLMAGLKVLSVDEWLAQAGPAPDPGAPVTTMVSSG